MEIKFHSGYLGSYIKSKKMTIIEYTLAVTDLFNDKRVVKKAHFFQKTIEKKTIKLWRFSNDKIEFDAFERKFQKKVEN